MQPEFWLRAWEDGRRGFHKDAAHSDLVDHARDTFAPGAVLVPLCGATHDLGWLADNGYDAIGVELSPIAVDELCDRYALRPEADRGPFQVVKNGRITVLRGDFFALEPEHVGPLTGLWDRAALVAMHPDQRREYTAVEQEVLGKGALLLNVFDYDATRMDGPPWATADAAVRSLWPDVELIEERSAPGEGRFEVVGTMTSRLYRRS